MLQVLDPPRDLVRRAMAPQQQIAVKIMSHNGTSRQSPSPYTVPSTLPRTIGAYAAAGARAAPLGTWRSHAEVNISVQRKL